MVTFGSVCSGIEAASVAWEPLGWKALWLAEVAKFPSKVLAHRFPAVPNLGDMTKITGEIQNGRIEAPRILIGGTPCQTFSTQGKRAGLTDPRGLLALHYCDLFSAIEQQRKRREQPEPIAIWENVAGCLSSDGGKSFGCILAGLAGLSTPLEPGDLGAKRWGNSGYLCGERRVAWRILDAQYFGVAQRRRRVFIVASPRGSRVDPRKVLFDSETQAHHCKGVLPRKRGGIGLTTATCGTCGNANARGITVVHAGRWRRLTIGEEATRQGFPPDWTDIGENTPIGPQYKAYGNSMAVPVIRWLGDRILLAQEQEPPTTSGGPWPANYRSELVSWIGER